jgi:hypothetical protein
LLTEKEDRHSCYLVRFPVLMDSNNLTVGIPV